MERAHSMHLSHDPAPVISDLMSAISIRQNYWIALYEFVAQNTDKWHLWKHEVASHAGWKTVTISQYLKKTVDRILNICYFSPPSFFFKKKKKCDDIKSMNFCLLF
ncbi:hypothetical protein J3459_008359 [Metarhizium acridum]|nr:hypothetical protein J3459_008359 [Metarhizium acridum]